MGPLPRLNVLDLQINSAGVVGAGLFSAPVLTARHRKIAPSSRYPVAIMSRPVKRSSPQPPMPTSWAAETRSNARYFGIRDWFRGVKATAAYRFRYLRGVKP